MQPILGKDVIVCLYLEDLDDPVPIFCATDCAFNVAQEKVLTTSPGAGAWTTHVLRGLTDWNVTLSGLTKIENDGQVSWFYLLQQNIRGKLQDIEIQFEDPDGNIMNVRGMASIPSMAITAGTTGHAQADVTFDGSGAFSMSQSVAPPTDPVCDVQETFTIILPEGATSVQDNRLIGDGVQIINLAREGTTFYQVGIAPQNLEFRHNKITGQIFFSTNIPAIEGGERITIAWQILS